MISKLKDNLASIAALIGALVAIGGGFVKYGEITTKLQQLEANQGVDLKPITSKVEQNEKDIATNNTGVTVNSKEIELLKLQIKEIQISSKNPLGG